MLKIRNNEKFEKIEPQKTKMPFLLLPFLILEIEKKMQLTINLRIRKKRGDCKKVNKLKNCRQKFDNN